MLVYGYDDNKNVLPAELPTELVVAAKIHPYMVDVFDPASVKIQVEGATLNFTSLRDFTFAFTDGDICYVGVHDGKVARCLRGTVIAKDIHSVCLKNISSCRTGFDELLRQYYERINPFLVPLTSDFEIGHEHTAPDEQTVWLPGSLHGLVLDRGQLRWVEDLGHAAGTAYFGGEMLGTIAVPLRLPQAVNAVFESFADLKPVVVGRCLADAILGRAPKDIEILVGKQNPLEYCELLKKFGAKKITQHMSLHPVLIPGGPQVSAEIDGCAIYLIGDWSRNCVFTRAKWEGLDFSVDQLAASRCDLVEATRIALHDLGASQFRLVKPLSSNHTSLDCQIQRSRVHMSRGFAFRSAKFQLLEQSKTR